MDLEQSHSQGVKSSNAATGSSAAGDQKELAWAFIGLILWSAVVFGALFGLGYVVGHSVLHWW
jgi:hypothetical protein